jgi:hypothetical protein
MGPPAYAWVWRGREQQSRKNRAAQIKTEQCGTRSGREIRSGVGHGVGAGHGAVRAPREAGAGVRRGRLDASPRPNVRALAFPLPRLQSILGFFFFGITLDWICLDMDNTWILNP